MKNIKKFVHIDKDSFFVGPPGNWLGIHIDTPWGEDRQYGCPNSVYLHLGPLGCVHIGLPDNLETVFVDRPPEEQGQTRKIGDREIKISDKYITWEKGPWRWTRFQTWTPFSGYRSENDRSSIITYMPQKWMICQHKIDQDTRFICGLFRWHFWRNHFVDMKDTFYEDDEPVEEIREAFARGEKGFTAEPDPERGTIKP